MCDQQKLEKKDIKTEVEENEFITQLINTPETKIEVENLVYVHQDSKKNK